MTIPSELCSIVTYLVDLGKSRQLTRFQDYNDTECEVTPNDK